MRGVYPGGYQSTSQGSGYVAEHSAVWPCQSSAKAHELVQQYLSATCVKIVLIEFSFSAFQRFIKSSVEGRLSDPPSGSRERADPLPARAIRPQRTCAWFPVGGTCRPDVAPSAIVSILRCSRVRGRAVGMASSHECLSGYLLFRFSFSFLFVGAWV